MSSEDRLPPEELVESVVVVSSADEVSDVESEEVSELELLVEPVDTAVSADEVADGS